MAQVVVGSAPAHFDNRHYMKISRMCTLIYTRDLIFRGVHICAEREFGDIVYSMCVYIASAKCARAEQGPVVVTLT